MEKVTTRQDWSRCWLFTIDPQEDTQYPLQFLKRYKIHFLTWYAGPSHFIPPYPDAPPRHCLRGFVYFKNQVPQKLLSEFFDAQFYRCMYSSYVYDRIISHESTEGGPWIYGSQTAHKANHRLTSVQLSVIEKWFTTPNASNSAPYYTYKRRKLLPIVTEGLDTLEDYVTTQ